MSRLTTMIATGAVAAVVGAGASLAVPALADGSGTPRAAAQQQAITQFLADHPRAAQALAARAGAWQKVVAANPGLASELATARALPPAQRTADLRAYFRAHPDQRAALRAFRTAARASARQQRATRRQGRQQGPALPSAPGREGPTSTA